MKRSITCLFLLITLLASCQQAAPQPPLDEAKIEIRFTFWGSEMEKLAIEQMVTSFEGQNPDVDVIPIQIAYEEYLAQITAMIEKGESPDIGYMSGLQAQLWAEQGKILDLTQIIQEDPLLASALPQTRYFFKPGKIAGLNTAVEATYLFYNKALFDQAGLDYPPSDPEKAWTWDEFVYAAQKLTMDAEGKHPDETRFDPATVRTFGAAFDKTYEGWTFYPFIFSNGGEVTDPTGTQLLLDSPEAAEALQKMADLMWVQRVAPTPYQDQNLPGYVTMLQTGNLAMHISGQWSLLDYASVSDLEFGVAVLPALKEPVTVILGSPTVIFADTKNLDAVIRFYKFHNDPEAVDLFARGLWMPLQAAYYTEPEKMNTWLKNETHPDESWPAFTDYVLNYSVPVPSYYVRNYAEVLDLAIRPAIESIWNNNTSAVEALAEAARVAKPLMQGRWDQ